MKKSMIAWVVLAALFFGVVAMTVTAEAPEYYRVGYSKVDINPYDESTEDPNDLVAIPMAGNGFEDQRLSYEGKLDDNGDGVVDENDGLFATCIAITDSADNTLLQFNIDIVNISPLILNPVRQRLVEKYPFLEADRIMLNASHTHSGPYIGSGWKTGYSFSEDYVAYAERLISQLVLAADIALEDRTPATMYKGTLEANDSKAAKGDIGDTLNEARPEDQQVTVLPGEEHTGRLYNSVRHYRIVAQDVMRTVIKQDKKPFYYFSYTKKNGSYIADPNAEPETYFAGDNFNAYRAPGVGNSSEMYYVDENGNRVEKSLITFRGEAGTASEGMPYIGETDDRAYVVHDVEVAAESDHVSETDDTLQVLEFRFDEKYNKKPIVLVNWRAHTTLNRTVSDDYEELKAQGKYQDLGFYSSYYQMSSDWVNALRFVLERKGYRPAFLQGAAGNINPTSRAPGESDWLTYETDTDRTYVRNIGNIYGSELAEVVLECLNEHMVQINEKGGELRTVQVQFQTERKEIPIFEYMAGLDYKGRYDPAAPLGNQRYTDLFYYEDANGEPLIDTTTGSSKVNADGQAVEDANGNLYTDAQGDPVVGVTKYTADKTYIITSIHHAKTVAGRYGSNGKKSAMLELNVIMIGKEFAMVTAPNELFDRYSETDDPDHMTDNLWTILDDYSEGSYGEPFIAGYSNGSNSYLPSSATYYFSEGTEKYATGSYETLTSQYAPGNGEAVIRQYRAMLDYLQDPKYQNPVTKEGYCSHCEKQMTWTELTADTGNVQLANIRSGHYYLSGNTTLEGKKTLVGANICLDIGTHTLTVKNGLTVTAGAALSMLGSGTVSGMDAPENGGVFTVEENGTLNLYEATVQYDGEATREGPITNGGIVNLSGTLNMYGGKIRGTTIYWVGGTVYIGAAGQLNMYGGEIREASDGRDALRGDCVLNRGVVTLTGDAVVDDIDVMPYPEEGGPERGDAIILRGVYTGKLNLTCYTVKDEDLGNTENADYSTADITINKSRQFYPLPDGTDLIGKSRQPMLLVNDTLGVVGATGSLATAFTSCTENDRIVLINDISNPTLSYALPNSVRLDLNGYDFYLPKCTVKKDCTLTVMDSATADYDISDGEYGTVTLKSGNIVAAPATEQRDAYLALTEEDGAVSFHAVGLNIREMALNTDSAGLYYVNDFNADHRAKEQVASYGVALSVQEEPNADNMGVTGKFTQFSGDSFGTGEATSSLVYGVMKQQNDPAVNSQRAEMPIYGRAYVQLKNGEYLFGVTRVRSLRQQVELADRDFFSTYETQLKELYATFQKAMEGWEIPNLRKTMG